MVFERYMHSRILRYQLKTKDPCPNACQNKTGHACQNDPDTRRQVIRIN